MASAWTGLEAMWKNRGLVCKGIHKVFLCPLTSVHVKKGGTLLSDFHHRIWVTRLFWSKPTRLVATNTRKTCRKDANVTHFLPTTSLTTCFPQIYPNVLFHFLGPAPVLFATVSLPNICMHLLCPA
jgi:hypothetical protein